MIRRNPLQSLFTLLAASVVMAVAPAPVRAFEPDPAAAPSRSADTGRALVESPRHATIVYQEALTPDAVLDRAAADAERLGLTLVKTLSVARSVIVEGTPDQVRARLSGAEGLPIATVAPTYLGEGDPHPLSMMAFTGRVRVTFANSAREAEKEAFYAVHGLRLIFEDSHGAALVETGRQPDASMIGFAEGLLANRAVERAVPEVAFTGEPTAAESVQINDPYFGLQWPLFADGQNTNFGFGRVDADMDVPRAWMINRSLGNPTFGSPNISVAVFDSGTERTHPDLATSLDPAIGRDFVEGGLPDPARNTLGAHGTAMASLVAGAANSVGMIGVAPGVKIYTSRIFGSDYSTTNARITSALSDSISAGVDINLHPYVIPVACDANLVAGEVDLALRQTFESGRSGVGIINVAAAGNFFSQVEYPASSPFVIAVGAHSAEDNRIVQSNMGGLGVDIVMPSYRINLNNQGDEVYGTGIIAADLTGPEGFAGAAPLNPGNSNRQWGALGNVSAFPRTTPAIANSFLGTSVSAAYAAGAIALLLSDERYTCLPPHIDYGRNTSRADRRRRATPRPPTGPAKAVSNPALCPPRQEGDNILRVVTTHNDLPSARRGSQPEAEFLDGCGFTLPRLSVDTNGRYEYLNRYNEIMGFGRFNPARALARTPQPTENTVQSTMLRPLISYSFGAEGEPGDELDPEIRPGLTGGWTARGDNDGNGVQTVDEEEGTILETNGVWIVPNPGGVITSPYLEPVPYLTMEDGSVMRPEGGSAFFVWSDSATVTAAADLQTGNNLIFNPRGAYQRNTPIEVIGPKVPITTPPDGRTPGFVTAQLGFELGVQNASSSTQLNITQELDQLNLIVRYFVREGETLRQQEVIIHSFTGDTLAQPKRRLCAPASRVEINQAPIVGNFPQWAGVYNNVSVRTEDMPIRSFSFLMPPMPEGTEEIQFALRLNPGASYLPTYRLNANGVLEQMFNVFRDHGGFVLYGLQAFTMREEAVALLETTDFVLNATGTLATFTMNSSEVAFANSAASPSVAVAKTRAQYLGGNRTDLENVVDYSPIDLLLTGSTLTGLKGSPTRDLIALSTAEGRLFTATSDGANLRLLSTEPGVRDPSWSNDGTQLLYATPNAIKVIVFQPDGSVVNETIMSDAAGQFTDFRTPVFDRNGGVIYFSATRRNETPAVRRLHMASRTGRVINLTGEPNISVLPGWGNVEIYDIDISQSGRRMMFVANTRRAPRLSPEGVVLEEAQPSNDRRIFIVENIHHVTEARNLPAYSAFAPDPGFVGFRYPRFSYNDRAGLPRIVFNQLTTRPAIASYAEKGQLFVRTLPRENVACAVAAPPPTPAPSTTPVPTTTPPPLDTATVIQMSEITFEASAEGWSFGSAAPVYAAPTSGYLQGRPQNVPPVDGSLTLTTNGNNNTFGFWTSPSPAFAIIADSLYLVRARVRATGVTDDALVPQMRLRANSGTNEHASLIVTNSQGDLSLSPSVAASRTRDLLIAPPIEQLLASAERRGYSIAFDLANFNPADSPNGGLRLEQVEVFRLDNGAKHYGLWCFTVPEGGSSVTLTVTGSSARPTPLYLELRGCCGNATTALGCAVGSSASGASITLPNLQAGQYTLVASSALAEDLSLVFTSSAVLIPDCAPCITTKEEFFDSILTACETSTPVTGVQGTVTRPTFYDGTGIFPRPTCDPNAADTVAKGVELIYSNSLNTEAERGQWGTGGAEGFSLPTFSTTDRGLAMQFGEGRSTVGFGFWVADGNTIALPPVAESDNGPWIYRATVVLSSTLPPQNALNSPVIRMRLSTSDFQIISEVVVEPGVNQNLVPVDGRPTVLEVYLPLDRRPANVNSLVLAFDLIDAFPNRPATGVPVVLENVRVERVQIPNYPTPQ